MIDSEGLPVTFSPAFDTERYSFLNEGGPGVPIQKEKTSDSSHFER